jgi:hypothetical protein
MGGANALHPFPDIDNIMQTVTVIRIALAAVLVLLWLVVHWPGLSQ